MIADLDRKMTSMVTKIDCPHSASQIKKAGQTLRRHARNDPRATPEKVEQATEIAKVFRAAHQYPLSKANMGLRSMVSTEGCRVEISQRLKRWPTILDKLQREPTLDLSRMQDIGGCRAILDSIDDIRRVEARIRKNRSIVGYCDYVAEPRPSGYRGVHMVVEYPVQELMAAVSRAMADQESGRTSDEALLSSIRTLRARASQSLEERHGQG